MIYKGCVHKFGDNIDTDVIIPARYLTSSQPEELALHCMEDIQRDFASKVLQGDIIVAGKNFGCGSSREHAPIAIKASGISCIIAESFARIFYRNAINIGLPILECPKAINHIMNGDELLIDLDLGTIVNLDNGTEFTSEPFPEFVKEIIAAGGLVEYVKTTLKDNKNEL